MKDALPKLKDSLQVGRSDPDAALCATVSTPFPETIQPEELAAALLSAASGVGESAECWAPHLERLFAETPAPMVIRFYDRHPGELGDLGAAYRWPKPALEHRDVLETILSEVRACSNRLTEIDARMKAEPAPHSLSNGMAIRALRMTQEIGRLTRILERHVERLNGNPEQLSETIPVLRRYVPRRAALSRDLELFLRRDIPSNSAADEPPIEELLANIRRIVSETASSDMKQDENTQE